MRIDFQLNKKPVRQTAKVWPDEPSYVLVTAAYNEAGRIPKLIESVTGQTVLPKRWVIVADGCTDNTADIVREQTRSLPFVDLVELERGQIHDFASKVRAFEAGVAKLDGVPFDFIGNLDADISFSSTYFADLLAKFAQNTALGIAGGAIWESHGGKFRPRPSNTTTDVAGAVQLFRRCCFDGITGFLPLKYGGEDWAAQVNAQMAGWEVETFPELPVLHHHPAKNLRARTRRGFRQGLMDFALGSGVLFEIARLGRRMDLGTGFLECTARLFGYLLGFCKREKRLVSHEFVHFLRAKEQQKLRNYIRALRQSTSAFLPARNARERRK